MTGTLTDDGTLYCYLVFYFGQVNKTIISISIYETVLVNNNVDCIYKYLRTLLSYCELRFIVAAPEMRYLR